MRPLACSLLAASSLLSSPSPCSAALLLAGRQGQREGRREAALVRWRDQGWRQAPQVCLNDPAGWTDLLGNACADYGAKQWCTAEGGYGAGWQLAVWGPFENYAYDGKAADKACCACGGGTVGPAPSCDNLQCPLGFSLRSGAKTLYCKSLECTVDADTDTCCEAPPEVKAAVDEARAQLATLKEEILANLSAAGAASRDALSADGSNASETLAKKLEADAAEHRSSTIQAAKEHFGNLTANTSSLEGVATYQISMSGFFAARAATATQEGRPDAERIRTVSTQAALSFTSAADAWGAASSNGKDTMILGAEAWSKYHADLNATWPRLLQGIASVNAALNVSEAPAAEVRWSEQSMRLASDFAQVARTQAMSLRLQVASAAERASAAREATSANAGLLDELEAQTDRAEAAAAEATGGGGR